MSGKLVVKRSLQQNMAARLEQEGSEQRRLAYADARVFLYGDPADPANTQPFHLIRKLLQQARSAKEPAAVKFLSSQIRNILKETVTAIRDDDSCELPHALSIVQDAKGDTTVILDLSSMQFCTTEAGIESGPPRQETVQYQATNQDGNDVLGTYTKFVGLPRQWPVDTFASSYTAIAMTRIYSIMGGSVMTGAYEPRKLDVPHVA